MTDSAQTRVVARTGDSLRTELVACGHELVADEPNRQAYDPQARRRLWVLSEELCGSSLASVVRL